MKARGGHKLGTVYFRGSLQFSVSMSRTLSLAPLSFPPLKSLQSMLVPVKNAPFSLSEWEPSTPIASANCEDVGRLK